MKNSEEEKRVVQDELIKQLRENEYIQRKANEELEAKVEERTYEIAEKNHELEQQNEEILTQRDLVEQQKKEIETRNSELEQLNEEKNHLISIVAHDLRNPLASAMSMAELLKSEKDELTEDQENCVKIIDSSVNRMDEMIRKILDIRAVEAKKINLNPEKVDPGKILKEVVDSFQMPASKKGIKLNIESEEGHIVVDRDYFTQVVENLVSNAVKFSPQKTQVWVRVKSNGSNLNVVVQDEGPGMTKEDKSKLFGKFQRLSAKPTGGESSTGLGLSIAKKYVEAMKGKIYCESKLGKGTTFHIEFEKVS